MFTTGYEVQNPLPFLAGSDNENRRAYWDEKCQAYGSRLASYANHLTNHVKQDAEDLVHDTYCRAFAHMVNPRSIKNPQAYLLRMMRNAWIDRWKKENRANVESLEEKETRQVVTNRYVVKPTVLQSLEREDLRKEFTLRRGRLNEREAKLLNMLFEGKTVADIAFELDEEVRVVRAEINAVRSKIRYRVKQKAA